MKINSTFIWEPQLGSESLNQVEDIIHAYITIISLGDWSVRLGENIK